MDVMISFFVAISVILFCITIVLICVYSLITEIVGSTLFYKINKKMKKCDKYEVTLPIINYIGYTKYCNGNELVPIFYFIAIIVAVFGIKHTFYWLFVLLLISRVYLCVRFRKVYNIPISRIILTLLFGKFVLLIELNDVLN